MFFQTLQSWLRPNSKKAQRKGKNGNAKRRNPLKWLRPACENLEDRIAPASFGQELQNQLIGLEAPLNNLFAAANSVPLVGNRLKDQGALRVFDDPKLAGI